MGVTKIIAIRHGETIWNVKKIWQGHTDSELTITGIHQAKELSRRLGNEEVDAIYSSDLERAKKTAEIIALRHKKNVYVDQRLRERNLGIFEGLKKEQIINNYPGEFELYKSLTPDFIIPNGESIKHKTKRTISCIEELIQKHLNKTFLVITHGGILDTLLRYALNLPLDEPRNFKLLNASINIFLYENENLKLQTWGDISHLKGARSLDDL